ncbi:histidinol dehydrogenase [Pseudomonas sp. StFLB209]|nr:histidinol dehydrogenase [Pseudomonas sp. StFLB209]
MDEVIIDEAAQWMALLQSGHVSPQEFQAFNQWREDPRRAEIFDSMGAGIAVLQSPKVRGMSRESLLHTLNAPSGRRRFLRNSLALAGLAVAACLVTRFPASWLQPDRLVTGTGQRTSLTLADGSALTLDARSSVLTRFDQNLRSLQLLEGALWVDVAKDPARPFVVQTAQGQMRALGTRFLVREDGQRTHIVMLHNEVEITTRHGTVQLLREGQRATFDAERILHLAPAAGDEAAWTNGLLEVRDRPLGEVIATLRNYRPGIIRVSPEASAQRLSGIYPLDDTDLSLRLLQRSLPIRVDYHTPYWVSIDLLKD